MKTKIEKIKSWTFFTNLKQKVALDPNGLNRLVMYIGRYKKKIHNPVPTRDLYVKESSDILPHRIELKSCEP
jgi:hypothetical protein